MTVPNECWSLMKLCWVGSQMLRILMTCVYVDFVWILTLMTTNAGAHQ